MKISVFEYNSCSKYLDAVLNRPNARGQKAELARSLSCQMSYISQILKGEINLSLEHALGVSQFLSHSEAERDYFMLILLRERSGTTDLKGYFDQQIAHSKKRRQAVRDAIGVNEEISETDQAIYYSGWWYSAIHVATLLPQVKTRDDIVNLLGISTEVVERTLDFLISRGLVFEKQGQLQNGKSRVHLGTHSALLPRHHANWRTKAIEVQERIHPKNLHFSGVIAISKKDGDKITAKIMEMLKEIEELIKPSKEERLYVLGVDFFKLTSPTNLPGRKS
jgi:uncharacterized protein (TIGR02147 family)